MDTNICKAVLLGALLTASVAFSQTPEPAKEEKKVDLGLDGMAGISVGKKTVGINVGGPSLKFRINKFKIGVAAMPSLFIRDDRAVPRLAVGPVAEYGHWMLIAPYYGYDNDDRQIWTFGAGYKFF